LKRFVYIIIFENGPYPSFLTVLFLIGVLLLCAHPIHAQVIVTVAGTSAAGYSGDGGPATSATLNIPTGIAFDKSGNLLIADQENSVIRRLDISTGIITTIAGNGPYPGDGLPATRAGLYGPTGLAIDKTGNIFVVEEYGAVVRKIDAATGIINTIGGIPRAGFSYTGDGGPATKAGFFQPTGIALDASGNIYIADRENNVVREINASTGIISTAAGYYPGYSGYSGDGGPANRATLSECPRVALDQAGNLLIGDQSNNVIRKVDAATGIIHTIAGTGIGGYTGDGGLAGAALLKQPSGAIVDANGNIYITDSYNNVIRKIDATTGIISTVAGNGAQGYSGDGGPALNATFYRPVDMAFDASGNLYIADAHNNVIRKIIFCQSATPAVSITQSPATVCTSNPVFTAVPVNGGLSQNYQWQLNGVDVGTNSPTYTASNVTLGAKVTCIVTSKTSCGLATAVSNPLTVTGPLMANLVDNEAGCAGDTLRVKASNPLTQITWYNGATTVATATNTPIDTTYITSAPGTYTAFVSGEGGCTMMTNAFDVKPSVSPAVSINASATSICAGGLMTFTATSSNGGPTPVYQWQVNGGTAGANAAQFTSNSLTDKDVVTCQLTSDAVCPLPATVSSNVIAMTVNPLPQIQAMPDISLPAGQEITLNPQVTGDINWYSWSPGTGLSDSTIRDPLANPAKTTTYTLTVRTSEGCTTSGTEKVQVYARLKLPNAFTPNGDGRNDIFYVLGGPPGSTIKDFTLYDRWGQKIFQAHDVLPANPAYGWNGTYNGALAPSGTYVYSIVIRFTDGTQQVLQGTVVLVR